MTEYRCHGTRCSCGHFNMIQPPEEVAMSNFGPRVHAAAAYLAANHNVTRRGMVERVSDACEPTYNTLKRYCAKALYLNADDTGWKNNGRRRWLWTFVADICVIFVIAASRDPK